MQRVKKSQGVRLSSTGRRKFIISLVCVTFLGLCRSNSRSNLMLTGTRKDFLHRIAVRAKTEQCLALRAKIWLALDKGYPVSAAARDLRIERNTVKKWVIAGARLRSA
jgi:hypothetical protein